MAHAHQTGQDVGDAASSTGQWDARQEWGRWSAPFFVVPHGGPDTLLSTPVRAQERMRQRGVLSLVIAKAMNPQRGRLPACCGLLRGRGDLPPGLVFMMLRNLRESDWGVSRISYNSLSICLELSNTTECRLTQIFNVRPVCAIWITGSRGGPGPPAACGACHTCLQWRRTGRAHALA